MKSSKKKIICVASLGGHWIELLRISKVLEEKYDVTYISMHEKCATMVGDRPVYVIKNFTRRTAWNIIPNIFILARAIIKVWPAAIVTTGSAPGLLTLLVGKFFGRKGIFIESIANAEEHSATGIMAGKLVRNVYTQWPHLVDKHYKYAGSIFGESTYTDSDEGYIKSSDAGRFIFCTVGTQMPFDRFVKAIDEVAPQLQDKVVVQAFRDKYEPKNIELVDFLEPDEFNRLFGEARLIVGHCGTGTILNALTTNKPVIVLPRLAKWGEHLNDHQLATARKFEEGGYAYVVEDEEEMKKLMLNPNIKPLKKIGNFASKELIDEVCRVIG